MTTATVESYRTFRRGGYCPRHAIRAARTVHAFRNMEQLGLARIIARPDDDDIFDTFDLNGHVDEFGRYVSADEERAELAELVERTGAWIVASEVRTFDAEEWETIDCVGGCTGYDDPTDPVQNSYVTDLMAAAISHILDR